MTEKKIITSILFAFIMATLHAQTIPTINPTATFISDLGEETTNEFTGAAPIVGKFFANTHDASGWNANFEWRFYSDSNSETPYLLRYEENTEFTFKQSGKHFVKLYAIFTQGTDTIQYTQDYWVGLQPISISVAESRLEMPNAFSPNGDGINDIYKAKDGYQSLIEFKATIYNRWGQKLFEWNHPTDGWDGKYNGKDVSQGVYYVVVKAKGADGKLFNIKRDVNLLRGFTETTGK